MRWFVGLMTAVAVGASALAGCSQGSGAVGAIDVDPKGIEAHVTKLAGETLKGASTEAAKLEIVRDLLPAEVTMSWGALTFDAATNSTLVTDLKLVPAEMPTVGLQVAELRLWDFDAELLKARVNGERLSESVQLARRIDAKGISVFGLADAINMGAGMAGGGSDWPAPEPANPLKFQQPEILTPAGEDWPPATEPEFEPGDNDLTYVMAAPKVNKFEISLGRMIIDDVMLKPYQVAPAPAAPADPYDPMATFMPMLQGLVAFTQSYGVDTAAYFDYKIAFDMEEAGQHIVGDMAVKTMGARGLRGGDIDGMLISDLSYAFSVPNPQASTPIDFNYSFGAMTLKDLRLEKALSYIVKGVFPPRTETNLLGLGIWRSEGESLKLAGKEIYSVAETMFDGTGFHWFVPTKLRASASRVAIDLGAIMEISKEFSPAGDPNDPFAQYQAEQTAEMERVLGLLQKHGLSKPTLDFNFGWDWNAGNGDARLQFGVGGPDLLALDATYEGGFPDFKTVSDLIPEDGSEPDQMALMRTFQERSSLKLIDVNVKDNGGLTKVFGLVGDFAPAMGMAPEPMSGDQIRSQVVEMVKSMAQPEATGIPEVGALLLPVAAFLETGGKLHIGVKPSKAMPFGTLMGTVMSAGMGSPAQAIQDLGLKVEHSK